MSKEDTSLPQNSRRLADNEPFQFSCHSQVACFTDCCRQLDLVLSPYDVIRLCSALGISSGEFLDRYAIIEKIAADAFPLVFLAMVDDGRASCPFVNENGCSVYHDRPGACRIYPVGRGAYLDIKGNPAELFMLLTEPHCRGFESGPTITIDEWLADQELAEYNEFNDQLMKIICNPRIKAGFKPDTQQQNRYLDVLYNLDNFRREVSANNNIDDKELLRTAFGKLHDELFG